MSPGMYFGGLGYLGWIPYAGDYSALSLPRTIKEY